MRKHERQVLENAIKTVNSVVNYSLENAKEPNSIKDYVKLTITDLLGYASVQHRFAGMKEKDFDEFCNTVFEIELVMIDKINNAKENEENGK